MDDESYISVSEHGDGYRVTVPLGEPVEDVDPSVSEHRYIAAAAESSAMSFTEFVRWALLRGGVRR